MRQFYLLQLRCTLAGTLFFFISQLSVLAQAKTLSDRYPVIPYPAHLVPENGDFILNPKTAIVVQSENFRQEAITLKQLVKEVAGIHLVESKK